MPFIPTFNAINDPARLRSNFDPLTGSFQSSIPTYGPNFLQTPATNAGAVPPAVPTYGNVSPGGDFFSQLAGLFGGMQQPAMGGANQFWSGMGAGRSTYQDMGSTRVPNMGLSGQLQEARRMPSPTGYGYDGGNRPLEQETRMRDASQRKSSMGQFGRASGGRGRNGTAGGFQPSMNYGKPKVSEGFGDSRGFGGFR